MHLEAVQIGKKYGPLRVLKDISLEIRRGTVHALVGENGAGKSTLGKIIAGAVTPDHGHLVLAGRPVAFGSPRQALDHGIAGIAQELSVVNSLSVTQNVYLGMEPRRAGFIDRRELRRRYTLLADGVGFNLPMHVRVGRLRTSEKQQVEILRALARNSELIVMDEPTAALSRTEVAKLHEVIRFLAAAGTTILLVSHFLDEVLELADVVTVLRDGEIIRTAPAEEQSKPSLIRDMLGRSLGAVYPLKTAVPEPHHVALTVTGLTAPGLSQVSFDINRGEILGLAGLVGAGRTELARAICGAERRSSGVVELNGRPLGRSTVSTTRAGVVMIAESRKEQGLLLRRAVSENISVGDLSAVSTLGLLRRKTEKSTVGGILERIGVRRSAAPALAVTLSGGNQQKILFGRALLRKPQLLLADEPTKGVDVGSKRAIYDLLSSLAAEGTAVLLISSDLEEVIGLAHRVLVIRAGRIVDQFRGDAVTEAAVLSAVFADAPVTQEADR